MYFTDDIPLTQDARGTIRVKGSRVTLYILISRYHAGYTAEKLHEGFPSVSLEQIQKILSWYRTNQSEVDEYVRKEEAEEELILRELGNNPTNRALGKKILRRKAQLTRS